MIRNARPPSPPPPSSSSLSSISDNENEELQRLENAPPFWRNPKTNKKKLSKQLSMCEIPRDMAWERRRRQFLCQERRSNNSEGDIIALTDEDLNELKGCIDLGFGFNEEDGQRLCPTIPALDLYFAVNRQFSTSPISSPNSNGSSSNICNIGGRSASFGGSPMSDSDSWKICSPGDDPEHVKTKLRHWAQAVACSVRQSS
ncbi:hypothetical protein PHJA_000058600 [Phtheirospermum japonicum]|uniref:Uncharacterized protein n=1 Tax=Phtheirospermum japonicum TaxID=374723 RepID=A0A830BAS5_9LAMI|nr:hypothetical protein PHJA_000058600 [Phtheirospermum japonicum]